MKILSALLILCLLTGCAAAPVTSVAPSEQTSAATAASEAAPPASPADPEPTSPAAAAAAPQSYASRFDSVTEILLSDSGITVDGGGETEAVFTSRDIIYYEDRDSYESGNPYGEGAEEERHSAEEAAAHTVVNITRPGAYRISGQLPEGQIRIDLGSDAFSDPEAVAELILSDADIHCSVAPAILFLNTYECDGDWSAETASADVDTVDAGANLILEGENTVTGSHVARIYKDQEEEKKLWKQDGAIYSYMSMNVFGPGALSLTADNEGLDTELHLTIHSGDIAIRADNDGINTNEDGVSVTTILGGTLRILAGLGSEGDGIDSNGYLVIHGGTVIASANPAADSGMDADLGVYIHGGTVAALGSAMEQANGNSRQAAMNLQFALQQEAGAAIEIQKDGNTLFTFDPGADPLLKECPRAYSGAILSCPDFQQGDTYSVFVNGIRQVNSGSRQAMGRPGGFGGGQMPEGQEGQPPQGEMGEGGMPQGGFGGGQHPAQGEGQGDRAQREEMTPPEGMEFPGDMTPPEGMEQPEGMMPPGWMEMPRGNSAGGESSPDFTMTNMVNTFSSLLPAEE